MLHVPLFYKKNNTVQYCRLLNATDSIGAPYIRYSSCLAGVVSNTVHGMQRVALLANLIKIFSTWDAK